MSFITAVAIVYWICGLSLAYMGLKDGGYSKSLKGIAVFVLDSIGWIVLLGKVKYNKSEMSLNIDFHTREK